MPPEQAAGKFDAVGPAADVYALARCSIRSADGSAAVSGGEQLDTLRQVLEQEPLSPSDLSLAVPRDLETIVLKCLEKSIRQRYASARELAEELQRFLDGRPILARPVGRLEHGWRWCRRNPWLATLLTVAAVLLLTITVVSTVAAVLINGAKNDAFVAEGKAVRLAGEKSKLATEKTNLAASLNRELFELGTSEQSGGNSPEAIAVLAKVYALTAENDSLRKSLARLLGGLMESAPIRLAHQGEVRRTAYSPDGTTVLTVSADGTARLWDARTGKPIGESMKHDGEVVAAAYSPDGTSLLTGSLDKSARLWDARTGKPIGEPMKHRDLVIGVAYGPSGTTLLTGSYDRTARLWDARTGKPIGEPMKHDDAVWAVAYSPDGTTVLTGSVDKTARLWDARTGRPVGEPMKHPGVVVAVAYSPDGTTMITGDSTTMAGFGMFERESQSASR